MPIRPPIPPLEPRPVRPLVPPTPWPRPWPWPLPAGAGEAALGHAFRVGGQPANPVGGLGSGDRSRLGERLDIVREEPPQVDIRTAPTEAAPPVSVTKTDVSEMVGKFKQFIVAAEAMKNLLFQRLAARTVTVDPKVDPGVRTAIRRLFGVNSSTITTDMFKEALKLRAELTAAGRVTPNAGRVA